MIKAPTLVIDGEVADTKIFRFTFPPLTDLAQRAVFVSKEGFVYDGSGKALPFSVPSPSTPDAVREAEAEAQATLQDLFTLRRPHAISRDDYAYIPALVFGYWNYFHLLIDCMPRVLLSLAASPSKPRILVTEFQNMKLQRSQGEILTQIIDLFGLQEHVEICQGEFFHFERAIIPRTNARFIGPAMQFFKAAAPQHERGARRRVYVSRRLASARRVTNEDDVISLAMEYGFEVVQLERMTLAEQITLFRESEVIMGPHGAGFANVVFCEPGATLIEFLQDTAFYKIEIFAELAALAQCEHIVLRAKMEDPSGRPAPAGNADMSVDCAELRKTLATFLDKNSCGVKKAALNVHLQGCLGDRMIQYMVARRIAEDAGGCRISNVVLPEWDIDHPGLLSPPGDEIKISGNRIDVSRVANLLFSRAIACVNMNAYAQRFPNFPDVELCRGMFKANENDHPGFGPECLVCDVKAVHSEDGKGEHSTLLPIQFYSELIRSSGLKPVFMVPIEDNAYLRALRQHFPDAVFHASRGLIADFQTFRNSKNLVPAVDTLSWLAAWLSDAGMILLPVNGMFHPLQCPDIDLLPQGDERYRFYLFPINYALPIDQFEEAHRALSCGWRQVRFETIAAMSSAMPRWPQRLDRYLELFDGVFYLQASPDVARKVVAGTVTSRNHYIMHGFREGRPCFHFDHAWYSAEYPLAAFEVGQGDYLDLRHHFVEVGAMRGYKPISDSRAMMPRWPRSLDRFLAVFDEEFYLHQYPDVARVVQAKKIKGRNHYAMHGFREGRLCFEFDERWYSTEYPLAAFEVGQGHYADFRHHFAEAGFPRGYKPVPHQSDGEFFRTVDGTLSAQMETAPLISKAPATSLLGEGTE